MKRTDIIQSLIDKVGAENYLEVGVSGGGGGGGGGGEKILEILNVKIK